MEFITRMPKCQGKDNIYVVVDRLKKFVDFFEVTSTISASEVAALGSPRIIISDKDSKFTGAFQQGLFGLVGKNMNMSTRYHPQTYGQTERVNQWLEGYLHNYVMV